MKEITVVTENHTGIVADILNITAKAGINIEQIDAEVVSNYGVIHLVADQYDKTMRALHNAGYDPLSEEVFLIKLEDKPGALAAIGLKFRDADIDILSLRLIRRDGKNSIASVSCNDPETAKKLIKDILVR
jgi:hypothetical protein